MKKYFNNLISFILLVIVFLMIRFPLFDLHGMKDWPFNLLIIGVIIIAYSVFHIKLRFLSIFTTIGYAIGFIMGLLFHYYSLDPGGGSKNNLWILWTFIMFFFIFIGIVLSITKEK